MAGSSNLRISGKVVFGDMSFDDYRPIHDRHTLVQVGHEDPCAGGFGAADSFLRLCLTSVSTVLSPLKVSTPHFVVALYLCLSLGMCSESFSGMPAALSCNFKVFVVHFWGSSVTSALT